MKPVTIEGRGVFVSANAAAKIMGVAQFTVDRQFCRARTWYGYPIRTVKRGVHWLADVRDVNVMAAVKRELAAPRGMPSDADRERFKALAFAIRAKLESAP